MVLCRATGLCARLIREWTLKEFREPYDRDESQANARNLQTEPVPTSEFLLTRESALALDLTSARKFILACETVLAHEFATSSESMPAQKPVFASIRNG
ncbi:unnamed protein product [Gongylonema pulchrum]|uniref:Transposase n=1 Tax=Gongylonema pulchrum TaxID=637853 RepID=A0A183EGE7_9BILA|nr:unnamed protein product [Gongylonema pulchrum]